MLNFNDLSLRRGPRVLFSHANFVIHRGSKVGLTGANGTGKSSLIAMILGDLSADHGDFTMPPNLNISHVAQETQAIDRQAIDYVIDGDIEFRALQTQLQQAEHASDGIEQAELHAHLESIGGYTIDARAAKLMQGLGFQPNQTTVSVRELSGGWRMRLNLAQALICRSDVLLLDEPTNHLDLDAVIWLQEWLAVYDGTLLLISHDRDFIDGITTHIAHIEHKTVKLYKGNYSAFEEKRAEALAQQQAAFEKQQREIAHIKSFVDRFKAKATKAKQAQSRLKALQKMELIGRAHADSPFDFAFRNPDKMPNPLLRLEGVAVGYAGEAVISDVQFTLAPGARIGLLGSNGAGKSTLIKLLAGENEPIDGTVTLAQDLRIGYFAQHQLEQLRADESPLQHFQRLDRLATEKELRNYLGSFAFVGDLAIDPVKLRSGGEKARLVLALLAYQRPNLLLLDEPTNHLDLDVRYALTVALQDYIGALVLVSHDRHLLRTVTDQFFLVGDGRVSEFNGDLDDYRLTLDRKTAESTEAIEPSSTSFSRKDKRRMEAEKRQTLQPLHTACRNAEKQLDKLQLENQDLESQLADSELYQEQNKGRLKDLLQQKNRIERSITETEESWLDACDALEQAEECLNTS